MQKNGSHSITTKSIPVEISLRDGSSLSGKVWVPIQGRLTDMLNDPREFIPIESRDGAFIALAKSAIKQIALPATEAVSTRGNDPYAVLGVPEDVSAEDLKRAYRRLCAHNHPDRIRGLGLGPEYEELATQNMIRINTAYAQLRKTMGVRE
jgi:DnaJ-domain-containing protein 1